jgi:hypothetical protein
LIIYQHGTIKNYRYVGDVSTLYGSDNRERLVIDGGGFRRRTHTGEKGNV